MPSKEEERAERLFRQQQDAPKALAEYLAKQEATRKLTAKLRAERLAREAIHGKPKPDRKRAAKSWVRQLKKAWLKIKNPKAPAATRVVDGTF
jgi:hypothetical protein